MKSLQLTKPHLIVIVGIPGSGKSFFAEQFSKTFNAPYVDLRSVRDMLPDDDTALTVWNYTLDLLMQTKQTLIMEGSGATVAERRELTNYAHKKGYQALYIWVQTEPQTAKTRATKGIPRQKNQHLIHESDFNDALQRFEALGASEYYMVISGKHTYASQAKNVLKKLSAPRAERAKLPQPDKRPTDAPRTRPGRITIN